MQHHPKGQAVTSHGKLSVGLTPDIGHSAYLQENHNLNDLPQEQLADAIDDGNARKSWLLNKFFYEESRGADHTRTDEIVSSCGSLREYLDLKTGYRAPSAMNGGTL